MIESMAGNEVSQAETSFNQPESNTNLDLDKPLDFSDDGQGIDTANSESSDFDKPMDFSDDGEIENSQENSKYNFDDAIDFSESKADTTETDGNKESEGQIKENTVAEENKPKDVSEGNESLTQEQKDKIKEETGWSDEIIDHIKDMDQYEIYKNADLHEAVIDGRPCLVKDIDKDYVDPKTGKTNEELMSEGKAPYDAKTGEQIELHHMDQDFDGPFAELCSNSEHGNGNDNVLHDKTKPSFRQDPEKNNQYNKIDRPNHWKARAEE